MLDLLAKVKEGGAMIQTDNSGCTIQIVLHKAWSCAVEHCDKDGKVLSATQLKGDVEPLLQVGTEGAFTAAGIMECDLFAKAVVAGFGQTNGTLALTIASLDIQKTIRPFLESGGAPYCQAEWELIRTSVRTGQLSLIEEKELPLREHVRIRMLQPTHWGAHLVYQSEERVDLSGSIDPGTYTKEEDKGSSTVKLPVTRTLLEVAALLASLKHVAARREQIWLIADSALNGALRVAWKDWEKALRGPLSTTVAVAFPWLLDALTFINQGTGRTYSIHWTGSTA